MLLKTIRRCSSSNSTKPSAIGSTSWRRRGSCLSSVDCCEDGVCLKTSIPEFDPAADRAWRTITPWIIWPSVYTGMKPREHGIIAFGQDTTPIQGRCVWDVLDKAGVSTGVFGSLLSFPPRNAGSACYYVPESLADDPDCFPAEAKPVQEFSVFTSRNYSENFARQYVDATRLLLGSMRSGVRPGTVMRTLLQIPRELLQGDAQVPERAMIQSYILTDAFKRLYADHKPRFWRPCIETTWPTCSTGTGAWWSRNASARSSA